MFISFLTDSFSPKLMALQSSLTQIALTTTENISSSLERRWDVYRTQFPFIPKSPMLTLNEHKSSLSLGTVRDLFADSKIVFHELRSLAEPWLVSRLYAPAISELLYLLLASEDLVEKSMSLVLDLVYSDGQKISYWGDIDNSVVLAYLSVFELFLSHPALGFQNSSLSSGFAELFYSPKIKADNNVNDLIRPSLEPQSPGLSGSVPLKKRLKSEPSQFFIESPTESSMQTNLQESSHIHPLETSQQPESSHTPSQVKKESCASNDSDNQNDDDLVHEESIPVVTRGASGISKKKKIDSIYKEDPQYQHENKRSRTAQNELIETPKSTSSTTTLSRKRKPQDSLSSDKEATISAADVGTTSTTPLSLASSKISSLKELRDDGFYRLVNQIIESMDTTKETQSNDQHLPSKLPDGIFGVLVFWKEALSGLSRRLQEVTDWKQNVSQWLERHQISWIPLDSPNSMGHSWELQLSRSSNAVTKEDYETTIAAFLEESRRLEIQTEIM